MSTAIKTVTAVLPFEAKFAIRPGFALVATKTLLNLARLWRRRNHLRGCWIVLTIGDDETRIYTILCNPFNICVISLSFWGSPRCWNLAEARTLLTVQTSGKLLGVDEYRRQKAPMNVGRNASTNCQTGCYAVALILRRYETNGNNQRQ